MPLRDFDKVPAGGRMPSADANRLAEAAVQMQLASVGGDLGIEVGAGGLQITDYRPKPIWGRTTGPRNGSGYYPFQQIVDSADGLPDDTASGFAVAAVAREVNGITDVPPGTKALFYVNSVADGFVFAAPWRGFFAQLFERGAASGQELWSFVRCYYDNTLRQWVGWNPVAPPTPGSLPLNAAPANPHTLFDQTPNTTVGITSGMVVWMNPSIYSPGYYEFVPLGYADRGKDGYVSHYSQVLGAGNKTFVDSVTIEDSLTVWHTGEFNHQRGAVSLVVRGTAPVGGGAETIDPAFSVTSTGSYGGGVGLIVQMGTGTLSYTVGGSFNFRPSNNLTQLLVSGPVFCGWQISMTNPSPIDPSQDTNALIQVNGPNLIFTVGGYAGPGSVVSAAYQMLGSGVFDAQGGFAVASALGIGFPDTPGTIRDDGAGTWTLVFHGGIITGAVHNPGSGTPFTGTVP